MPLFSGLRLTGSYTWPGIAAHPPPFIANGILARRETYRSAALYPSKAVGAGITGCHQYN